MGLERIVARIGELTGDAICIYRNTVDDRPAELVWANAAFSNITGYTVEDLLGKPPVFVHGDKITREESTRIAATVFGGNPYRGEHLCVRPDGSEFWVDYSIQPVTEPEEGTTYLVQVYRNIDRLRRREAEARRALEERAALYQSLADTQARMTAALDAYPDPFAIFDANRRVRHFNYAFACSIAGNPNAMSVGMTAEDILSAGFQYGRAPQGFASLEAYTAAFTGRWNEDTDPVQIEFASGTSYQISRSKVSTGDTIILLTDVTRLKQQAAALEVSNAALAEAKEAAERQMLRDELTRLGNRRLLDLRLGEMLAARVDGGSEVAVLHLDLDRFKHINDTMGHPAGDQLLCKVAVILTETAGPEATVVRFGGDEFIIAIRSDPGSDAAMDLADTLVRRLATPFEIDGKPCRVGGSVGVAISPTAGTVGDALIANSDIALYRAKQLGRGRAVNFNTDLQERVRQQKSLADDLLHALENGEIEPHYQPQFDVQSLDFVGVEALARWIHPARGDVPPSTFVEMAQELGIVDQIDRVVFHQALSDCSALYRRGLHVPRLSLNVSSNRIAKAAQGAEAALIEGYPGRVSFELLESIFLEEADDAFLHELDRLRDLGVDIEIDDFGSGRASIVALTRLAPQRLKIDRRLVEPIDRSEQACRLVGAILDIGRALDIDVVAEGVERPAHLSLLDDMGCGVVQGFLLASPMTMPALSAFIEAKAWRKTQSQYQRWGMTATER